MVCSVKFCLVKRLTFVLLLFGLFLRAQAASTDGSQAAEPSHEKAQNAIEKSLSELNGSIEQLNQRLQTASDEQKTKWRRNLTQMEQKRQSLIDDLARLKSSSGRAWGELRAGMEKALQTLKASISKARTELTEPTVEK